MYENGRLKEEAVVVEDQKALYPFTDANPFPAYGITSIDKIKW